MNIIIFTDAFFPKLDGVAVSIDNFCRQLSARGHNFVIFCPKYEKTDEIEFLNEKIIVYRFRKISPLVYKETAIALPSLNKIRKIIKEFRPDLVHLHSPGPIGQAGVLMAQELKLPLVGTYHSLMPEMLSPYLSLARLFGVNYFWRYVKRGLNYLDWPFENNIFDDQNNDFQKNIWLKKIIQKMCNALYSNCHLIITPSRVIKNLLHRDGLRRPIVAISNGRDLSLFSRRIRTCPKAGAKLLYWGRVGREKNPQVVLRAFALMLKERPDLTLTIAGTGPALEELKKESEKLKINDQVIFTTAPYNDSPKVFDQHDLFLTASTMETQGMVILEALASGLPCVGVHAFALPELIHHGRNGFLARPFNEKQMAELALKILNQPRLYQKFSTESLKIVAEHDLRLCVDKLEKTYQEIIKKYKIKN